MHWIGLLIFLSYFSVCYSCWCMSGYKKCQPKCYTQLELGFVIDGSHSINVEDSQNFARFLQFVKNIVSYFDVGPTMTRVGVVTYSNNAHVQMTFGSHKYLKSTLKAISEIPFRGSGTKTGQGLIAAQAQLFSKSRSKVRKALVVLTDGQSSDDATGPAKALKNAGVEVFAIGVGNAFWKQELMDIASDGRHIFTSGFKSLKAIENTVKNMICDGPNGTYKCQCPCGCVYTYSC
ncbi:vitrin-like [Actinia tenebrosa]|uniref:Vitrin-like n=1 Tax=Actinia tenebrosa TaxID=6105 RepID=A0A6P8I1I8_ACTTE|nr:vitrin-like [Actinia tenebrosa]